MQEVVLVSLCLLGVPSRYHGLTHRMGRRIGRPQIIEMIMKDCQILPLCGEQLGGLPTPRPPCKVERDIVKSKDGRRDFTREYNQGAQIILEQCLKFNVKRAYLLKDSPMCDRDTGVLGKLLTANGIRISRV